ncbi:DNA polymerase IV [Mycoplasmopsis californica]|uniref:DNA polymerase IV n=1 Tax=Mycoplasmopsis equigenitalium TaxID=114883 RepID=A0ABY5J517_9BACT|nr:DNA polymerase IV [Mycoplasmopsis equigenitalium]UUD37060.1 DNA polymerase IV [Mycoplasmopsis equigenitalium]VEU69640.1 DNA polymerase IV [Mycoplasmopsis californica]
MRVIFHIDFDSYFVSAIRTKKPWLIGKEVAIGNKNSNSIASALSYEAKNKGAKTGDPMFLIRKVCPNIIVESADFPLFIEISTNIFDWIINNISKIMEVGSIDECYVDVTKKIDLQNWEKSALDLARYIQSSIKSIFKIPISIGISYNKFLAKMSTSLGKPYGITLTRREDIAKHFYHLPIGNFFGIGKSSTAKLIKNNINTINDLYLNRHNIPLLESVFKRSYFNIIECLLGNSTDLLNLEQNEYKSIGHMKTFEYIGPKNYEEILIELKLLVERTVYRMKSRGLLGRLLVIEIRYKNTKFLSRQQPLTNFTYDEQEIFEQARDMFDKFWTREPIKGVGVKITDLGKKGEIYFQPKIEENSTKNVEKYKIVDLINSQLKTGKVMLASDYEKVKNIKNTQTKFLKEDKIVFKKNKYTE